MTKLRAFLWNDNAEKLRSWTATASGDGFEAIPISRTNPTAVCNEVPGGFPDVVVLDMLLDDAGTALGLEIAEAIRQHDRLVPIVAVTRAPEAVYRTKWRLDEYAFCGIYDCTVMTPGVFGEVAIRGGLNQWHIRLPEYVLVRQCLQAIRAFFGPNGLSESLEKLSRGIERLPFSGPIESWHGQVCRTIGQILEDRKLAVLGQRYRTMVGLFETSDPFFLAGSTARHHLSHSVQVFLLGLTIMLSDTHFREKVIKCVSANRMWDDAKVDIENAILIWGCISTTHDAAYLAQEMSGVTAALAAIANSFRVVVEPEPSAQTAWEWPCVSHGKVAADLWGCGGTPSETEAQILATIREAVCGHHCESTVATDNRVKNDDWARFLAMFCDELQDWQRLRRSAEPTGETGKGVPWSMFELESLRFERQQTGSARLMMAFVVQDHPRIVSEAVGTDAPKAVEDRFREMLKRLKTNLTDNQIEVTLSATFVSRRTQGPAVQSARLD